MTRVPSAASTSPPAAEPPSEAPSLAIRVRKVLGRIRRAFAVDVFDVFTKPVEPGQAFEDPSGYHFRWAEPEDIAGADPFHTELDEIERANGVQRLAWEHRAVVALAGETVVFSMWVNPRNLNVPGDLKRRLGDHQWFIYKAYTSPEHRGKKLYQLGMRFVLAAMAEAGLTELVGYAHVKKAISRQGLARLAFDVKGRYWAVRYPGLHSTIVSRRLARHFPEVVPRSRALSSDARSSHARSGTSSVAENNRRESSPT